MRGLIQTINQINDGFLKEAHERADAWLDKQLAKVNAELDALQASPDQRNKSLLALQNLRQRITKQRSLAHISQMQDEARDLADAAIDHLHLLAEQAAAKAKAAASAPAPTPVISGGGNPGVAVAEPTAPVVNVPAAVVAPVVPVKNAK